jgi:predicted nucleotidyltransferase
MLSSLFSSPLSLLTVLSPLLSHLHSRLFYLTARSLLSLSAPRHLIEEDRYISEMQTQVDDCISKLKWKKGSNGGAKKPASAKKAKQKGKGPTHAPEHGGPRPEDRERAVLERAAQERAQTQRMRPEENFDFVRGNPDPHGHRAFERGNAGPPGHQLWQGLAVIPFGGSKRARSAEDVIPWTTSKRTRPNAEPDASNTSSIVRESSRERRGAARSMRPSAETPKKAVSVQAKPMPKEAALEAFREQLEGFCALLSPSRSEMAQRRALLDRLGDLVQRLWPTARLRVFGSSSTNLCLFDSDLDVCVDEWQGSGGGGKPQLRKGLRKLQKVSDNPQRSADLS